MAKKVKKNGFIDGTLVSYIAIVFTKILGMIYIIPFAAMIGPRGKYIYSCVYIIFVGHSIICVDRQRLIAVPDHDLLRLSRPVISLIHNPGDREQPDRFGQLRDRP